MEFRPAGQQVSWFDRQQVSIKQVVQVNAYQQPVCVMAYTVFALLRKWAASVYEHRTQWLELTRRTVPINSIRLRGGFPLSCLRG